MSASPAIPEELVSRVRDGYAVPLIGSGLSRPSGVASWDQLIARLTQEVEAWLGRSIQPEELDLLEAPLLYSHLSESRQPLYDVLREAVEHGYKPNDLHHLIARMPFRTIATTNWDTLLEEAMRGEREVNVIYDNRTSATWRESRAVQLLKMHGTISDPDSIVFGEDDYQRFYGSESPLLGLVRTLFSTRSIVVTGFGMRDSYVKLLFGQVRQLAGRSPNPHYVVMPDSESSRLRSEYLKSSGFVVVPVPTTASDPYGVSGFLKELYDRTYIHATNRLERTRLILRESRRLASFLGSDKTIRMRATMGPFAVPDYTGDVHSQEDIFGGADQYQAELDLRNLCLSLAEDHGFRFRLIGSPLDEDWIIGKGYTSKAYGDRLAAFVDAAKRLGDQFEFAPGVRSSDTNSWIVSSLGLIESSKSAPTEQRLYGRATLESHADRVAQSIRWFDEEFDALVALAGGVSAARVNVVSEAESMLSIA